MLSCLSLLLKVYLASDIFHRMVSPPELAPDEYHALCYDTLVSINLEQLLSVWYVDVFFQNTEIGYYYGHLFSAECTLNFSTKYITSEVNIQSPKSQQIKIPYYHCIEWIVYCIEWIEYCHIIVIVLHTLNM